MNEEQNESNSKYDPQAITLTDLEPVEQAGDQVKGGIGMLLPAVQKLRDAAAR